MHPAPPTRQRDPEGALVLFHGRGADEHDLFPLLDMLDPERRLLGATARGPLSLPPGGAHWYAVHRVGYPDPETFHATYPQVAAWLDELLAEHGIAARAHGARRLLAGLGDVLRARPRRRPPAPGRRSWRSAASSPQVDGFELDLGKAAGLPVAIGHGTHDPVISVEFGRDARERLERGGRGRALPRVAHGAHDRPRFLGELPAWLRQALDSAAAEEPAQPVE